MVDPNLTTNPNSQALENKKVNIALTKYPYPYVAGMQLNADISLGDLTLNTIDSNGVVWVCTDVQGWWGHPEPQMPELTRGWGDGSYDARGRWAARDIVLTGVFLPPDPSLVEQARNTLISATSLVYQGDWLTVNESTPKTSYVRLSGRPDIATTSARGRTEFSIGLRAVDPIKYEYVSTDGGYRTTNISSGGTTISNAGNIRTPVIFEISGTYSSGTATITKTATGYDTETITGIDKNFSGNLEIDTHNREVLTVNGSTIESGRTRVSTLIDWIYLEPGNNTISFTGGSGLTCKMYYRSGWIG